MNVLSVQRPPCLIILGVILLLCSVVGRVVPVQGIAWSRCYGRLEHALDDMLYKSSSRSKSRSLIDLSGYRTHYDFNPERSASSVPDNKPVEWKTESKASEVEDLVQHLKQQHPYPFQHTPHSSYHGHKYANVIQPSRVEVSNVKFRVPRNAKWVKVDRCDLLSHNQSLDTRLSFPDLTIYGRVTLQPVGGHCDMILRLRRVGIDFKTSMLPPSRLSFRGKGFDGSSPDDDSESRNINVRTDSYFTEPGFMSIFAHGCAGPERTKANRINSKKPSLNDILQPSSSSFHERQHHNEFNGYANRQSHQRRFWYPIREEFIEHRMDTGSSTRERKLENIESMEFDDYPPNEWHKIEPNDHQSDEIASAFLRELESLFSKGAQGILTSYIQRMLQPAIKNTLMEGMGYTISYG